MALLTQVALLTQLALLTRMALLTQMAHLTQRLPRDLKALDKARRTPALQPQLTKIETGWT